VDVEGADADDVREKLLAMTSGFPSPKILLSLFLRTSAAVAPVASEGRMAGCCWVSRHQQLLADVITQVLADVIARLMLTLSAEF